MKVEIIKSWVEHEGFVRIEKSRLRFEKFDRDLSQEVELGHYHRGDAVGVLIYDPGLDRVLLIRQFRFAAFAKTGDGWLTECVAGMLHEGESPEEAARREVLEETGLLLARADLLTCYFPSPGGCSDQVYLYLGTVVDPSQPVGAGGLNDEGEDIEVFWLPLSEALHLAETATIQDAKTLIGVGLLARRVAM
ncbi:MAG: NUDIX hydrolase [Acidobacteriota bacterium]